MNKPQEENTKYESLMDWVDKQFADFNPLEVKRAVLIGIAAVKAERNLAAARALDKRNYG